MYSKLEDLQNSKDKLHHTPIYNRNFDTEESTYPFSPIRQRKSPKPPPRVELNAEGKYIDELKAYMNKDENSVVGIRKVTVKKIRKTNNNCKCRKSEDTSCKDQTMDDFDTNTGLFDDDFMYKKQPEIFMSSRRGSDQFNDFSKDLLEFSEEGKTSNDEKNGNPSFKSSAKRKMRNTFDLTKRKRTHDWLDNDSAKSIANTNESTYSRNFSCDLRLMGEFFKDLYTSEQITDPCASEAKRAHLNLSKWNWLLDWLEVGRRNKNKNKVKTNVILGAKKSLVKHKNVHAPSRLEQKMRAKDAVHKSKNIRKRKLLNGMMKKTFSSMIKGKSKKKKIDKSCDFPTNGEKSRGGIPKYRGLDWKRQPATSKKMKGKKTKRKTKNLPKKLIGDRKKLDPKSIFRKK